MRHPCRLLDLFWLLWVGSALFAEVPPTLLKNYLLRQWTSQQGLPGNSVLEITRGASGRVWVATLDGLAWTDGAAIHPVPLAGPQAGFRSLTEGPDATLWLGGQDGRVWAYRQGRFQDYTPPQSLGGKAVLVFDAGGVLWAGGTQGLWFRQKDAWARGPEERLNGADISALLPGRDGGVWVGTRGRGLWRLEPGKASRVFLPEDGKAPEEILALAETREGTLWVATNQLGVLRLEGSRLAPGLVPAPKVGVNSLHLEPGGALWLATGRGLFRWDGRRFQALVEPVPGAGVRFRGLVQDPEGGLWVGSRAGGLFQLRPRAFELHEPPGLSEGVVNAVSEGPWGLLVAPARGGIFSLGPVGLVPRPELTRGLPPETYLKDLLQDQAGQLWVAGNTGLFRVRKGEPPRRIAIPGQPPDVYTRAVFQARDGALWFGTEHGLHSLIKGEWRAYGIKDGLGHPYILSIQEDRSGRLLVGTNGGGLGILEGGRFRTLRVADGLPSEVVFRVHVDAAGAWWVGTSLGLCRIRKDEVQTFRKRQDRPEEAVHQVLEDSTGHLWLCAPSGLRRLEKAAVEAYLDGRGPLVEGKPFDQEEGLPLGGATSLGHSLVDAQGSLAVATTGGLLRLELGRLQPNRQVPPVEIWGLAVGGKELERGAGQRLPSRTDLEIRYTAHSTRVPSQVRFRYFLEGLDPAWREAGSRREAFYTRLPPGRYRFRVQACNDYGVWNEAGAALALRVLPRWYETWLFRFGLALASLGSGFGALAWRNRAQRHRTLALEATVAERTAELTKAHAALEVTNQELESRVKARTWELREALNLATAADRAKSHFLARMGHELRTPLNQMLLFTDLLKGDWTDSTGQPPPRDFEVIETAGRGLDALIANIMEFTELEAGRLELATHAFELPPLLVDLESQFAPLARAKGLAFSLTVPASLPTVHGDPARLAEVLRIILTNAIQFTATGSVRLVAHPGPKGVRLEVEDTGPGIPEAQAARVFEPLEQGDGSLTRAHDGTGLSLAIARRLVERMGGEIGFEPLGLVPKPPRAALGAPGGVPQGRRDEHSGSTRFEPDAVERCPPPQPEGTTPGGRSAASAPLPYEQHGPAGPSLQGIPPDDVAAHGGFGTSPLDGGTRFWVDLN